MSRPSWDEYFMRMAFLASERSTCMRRKVGAVLVKENQILATGYNGAPKGLKHCQELGYCNREKLKVPTGERNDICRAAHAEANSIAQAAKHGVSIDGAKLYSTNFPCSFCLRLILNSGIEEIIYCDEYFDEISKEILKDANIKTRQFKLKHSED